MTRHESVALSAPIDPVVAAGMLAEWGFLAHPDLPDGAGDAYLLVAMRDEPTLRHFDPERVEVWVSRGSRGTRIEITRQTRGLDQEYSWGMIAVFDRFGISNEYVTFGGRLTVTEVDGATVVTFVSPAPILRRGGHSQGWDEAAVDLAAFFGRLMIAVDYEAGFERRIAESGPLARYSVFVADSISRYRSAAALRAAHPAFWTLLGGEEDRLRRDFPDAWAEGLALARAAGLQIGG
jgi:hypothetical protein